MTLPDCSGWHLARITIEAVSPLSCASGAGQEGDVALVRDANGWPTIPGATIQGLLRRFCPGEIRAELFGADLGNETRAARLHFSNALVHESSGKANSADSDPDDPLLTQLGVEAPLRREHVRLDARHGAAKGGKFDRAAVPVGSRFSFEVLMRGTEREEAKVARALSGLAHPLFRIGGSGRRGYGRIKIVEQPGMRFFGCAENEAFRALRELPMSETESLANVPLAIWSDVLTIKLALKPIQPWRTGQGPAAHAARTNNRSGLFETADPRGAAADLVPLREPRIQWNGRGSWHEPSANDRADYVLPGSSIRGPLLHRAIFHLARRGDTFAGSGADISSQWQELRARLNPLFGCAADEGDAAEDSGNASPLYINDALLEVAQVSATDHIRIDRFTGGVVQGALYSQELVNTSQIALSFQLDWHRAMDIENGLWEAFFAALRDLLEGRLALGAKSLGYCEAVSDLVFEGTGADKLKAIWGAGRPSASMLEPVT